MRGSVARISPKGNYQADCGRAAREAAAGAASTRHDIPMVNQSDRYRAPLRTGGRGAAGARRGISYPDGRPGSYRLSPDIRSALASLIHDRMTEAVFTSFDEAEKLFRHFRARAAQVSGCAGRREQGAAKSQQRDGAGAYRRMKSIISRPISSVLGVIPPMWN